MESTFTIRQFLYKYAYLLIISAWLVTISFIIDHYWSVNSSLKRAEELVKSNLIKQEVDLAATLKDHNLISAIEAQNDSLSPKENSKLLNKNYFLFFYSSKDTNAKKPYYWNTQKAFPTNTMLVDGSTKGFVLLNNGYFVWEKFTRNDSKIIALIPLKWKYDNSLYEKDYLNDNFSADGIISDHYDIEAVDLNTSDLSQIKTIDMFRLKENQSEDMHVFKNNLISILLNLTALIIILFFFYSFASFISSRYRFFHGAVVLGVSSVLLAIISRKTWLPVNLRQFDLFDPSVFSVKDIFTSLGDLIIRFLLLLWIVIFIRGRFRLNEQEFIVREKIKNWSLLLFSAVMTVLSSYYLSSIIQSLVEDSKISFDVMDFFSLNKFTLYGFIAISLVIITYFFFNCLLVNIIKKNFRNFLLPFYVVVVSVFLLMLNMMIGKIDDINFEFFLLVWLLLFIYLLKSDLAQFIVEDKIIATKLVFWLVFFSLSASFVIKSKSAKIELERRLVLAKSIAEESDPSKVYVVNPYFNGINNYINPNTIDKLNNENPDLAILIDSLNKSNKIESCKENFNIYMFGFSAELTDQILFNKNLVTNAYEYKTYDELNNIFLRYSNPTVASNLRYFESEPNSIAYISRKLVFEKNSVNTDTLQIKDTTQKISACYFMLALPKKSSAGDEMIKGRLLQNAKAVISEKSSLYSWAIYKKTEGNQYGLYESRNYYPFKYTLNNEESDVPDYKVYQNGVYSELWYNAGGEKIICVVKENSILSTVTFFSYFFCSLLIIVFLLWVLSAGVRTRLNYKLLINYWKLSIRNQIHFSIISLSVFSFVIIGVSTIWFFKSKSDESNTEKVRKLVASERLNIEKILNSSGGEFVNINNENIKAILSKTINDFSETQNLDLVIYNLDGTLNTASSTIVSIFNKGIQNKMMNPLAFEHLSKKKEISFSQEEAIGDLKYISNYIALSNIRKSSGQKVLAYLNVPYLESQNNLKKDISNFLVAIINLNAFIFLIAGILSLFITQRISRSFSFISEKMKKINLTKQNESIEWNRDDEIGQLISEYNKMVQKLEESAEALAKTEREGAWREMAKQVAHEIKNPLTPMKLNLQFLQRAIANNDPNVKDMAEKMSAVLIEQIDHLSNIAGQFSQFANIGESRNEVININDLVKSIIQLLASTNVVVIEHELSPGQLFINADRTQMNRLFTNLILNAIQSVPETREAIVSVKEIMGEETVTIVIQDNGIGIDDVAKEKIFTPNFTTKNSGTGLGLAMCKKIVEQAGGEIWFETEIAKGTSFFVRLPKSLDQ